LVLQALVLGLEPAQVPGLVLGLEPAQVLALGLALAQVLGLHTRLPSQPSILLPSGYI